MADMTLQQMDLSGHTFSPMCEMRECTSVATVIAQGCGDKTPVIMCENCLNEGIELIKEFVRLYQRTERRVAICGDCNRPILSLDTHLEVKKLPGT
jgi:hypothetical protein